MLDDLTIPTLRSPRTEGHRRVRAVKRLGLLVAILTSALLVDQTTFTQPARAQSCESPPLSGAVAKRYDSLGGQQAFGCYRFRNASGAYAFDHGEITAIPYYGPSATFAGITDSHLVIHVYLDGVAVLLKPHPHDAWNAWLVSLSQNGSRINQSQYNAGDPGIGDNYADNVLVHPGGRHGALQVAMEGCSEALWESSTCAGWHNAVLDFIF